MIFDAVRTAWRPAASLDVTWSRQVAHVGDLQSGAGHVTPAVRGVSRSELRGPSRVALPLAFLRARDGSWRAKWLHLYLKGHPNAKRVEGNRVTVATLLRGVVELHLA